MDQPTAIRLISGKLKLVRTEQGYTQEKMAEILGISKKTLVQIEKGRNKANWTTVVAVCALFNHSEILLATIGDDPVEFIKLVSSKNGETPKEKTLGGKVWWKELESNGRFRLQQNLISHHYRILDEENYRWYSSFNHEETRERLNELSEN